jgi:hypothetical protein
VRDAILRLLGDGVHEWIRFRRDNPDVMAEQLRARAAMCRQRAVRHDEKGHIRWALRLRNRAARLEERAARWEQRAKAAQQQKTTRG